MAPRYDKYDGVVGGFRAKLNANLSFDSGGSVGPVCVSLNTTGKVVIGTGAQTGFVGVLVKNVPLTPSLGNIAGTVNAAVPIGGKAGDVVDIMTSGEIVGVSGLAAGTKYYAASDGTLSNDPEDGPCVGWTVEATRLVVRVVGAPVGAVA